jgi:hypothetical protein
MRLFESQTKMELDEKPWNAAKARVITLLESKLKDLGYDDPRILAKMLKRVTAKNKTAIGDLLLNSYEFNGEPIFVLFNADYTKMIDIDGNEITYPQLYYVPKTANYEDVYRRIEGKHIYGPYVVPIVDFKVLPAIVTKTVQSSLDLEFPDKSSELDSWDENISALTIKDLASIIMGYPGSDKEGLNHFIRKANDNRK